LRRLRISALTAPAENIAASAEANALFNACGSPGTAAKPAWAIPRDEFRYPARGRSGTSAPSDAQKLALLAFDVYVNSLRDRDITHPTEDTKANPAGVSSRRVKSRKYDKSTNRKKERRK
jgi:hypothetical protein